MNLVKMLKKVESLNEMKKELELKNSYYIRVDGFLKTFYIYNEDDFGTIENIYIDEITKKLLNSELEKNENIYSITIENEKFEIEIIEEEE